MVPERSGDQGGAGRFRVRSADGTSLAVWAGGSGPPLVLVHGSLCDHTRFDPLVAALRDDMATFAMDRRGFGASEDGGTYSIEREFEDVAAVIDGVAARAGEPVALWGHSYGASCAMGGAALSDKVGHLVLYEPSLGLRYPPGSVEAVEEALAAGDRDAAIRLVFVGILEMTEDDLDAMRASPLWPIRVATAPTVPRECRAEEGWVYRPGQFDGIKGPTLVLAGSETPATIGDTTRRAGEAIADARIRVLEGHGHMAHQTHPAMVAAIIREFVSS